MNRQQYCEQQVRQIREGWFKDHVAHWYAATTGETGSALLMLDWRKPGTGIYAVRYIIDRNTLIVTGDAGFAIYRWSQDITFDWLANCDIHYFAEKCEASEKGRLYDHWVPQLVLPAFEASVADELKDLAPGEECPEIEDALQFLRDTPMENRDEFLQTLWTDDNPEMLCNPEAVSALIESGTVIHPRCIAHLIGIKMAVASKQSPA